MQTIGRFVLVRTENAGVHCGTLIEFAGNSAVLEKARRLWKWNGEKTYTLNEVSLYGAPQRRLSQPVDEIVVLGVIEVLFPTEKARETLEASTWDDI